MHWWQKNYRRKTETEESSPSEVQITSVTPIQPEPESESVQSDLDEVESEIEVETPNDAVIQLCETLSNHSGFIVSKKWEEPAERILRSYSLEFVTGLIDWMFTAEKEKAFWPDRTRTMENLCNHIFRPGAVIKGKQYPPALILRYKDFVRRKQKKAAAVEPQETAKQTEQETQALARLDSLRGGKKRK